MPTIVRSLELTLLRLVLRGFFEFLTLVGRRCPDGEVQGRVGAGQGEGVNRAAQGKGTFLPRWPSQMKYSTRAVRRRPIMPAGHNKAGMGTVV